MQQYVRYLHKLANGDRRIVFTGKLIGESLHTIFHNAEVFVQPSSIEGMPMSVLECMAHCVPAILTDIPPHRELLSSIQEYDLFYNPGDVRALIVRFCRVFDNYQAYQKIAEAAKEHALNKHKWQNIAMATERVFYRAKFNKSSKNILERGSKETS
jgi:glycosyltransferase involved in cell wall biosynthesis